MIDLFSVEPSNIEHLGGSREATDRECKAYLLEIARRDGRELPEARGLQYETVGGYGRNGWRVCVGLTFGKRVAEGRHERIGEGHAARSIYIPPAYETGAFSVLMPGAAAAMRPATVTLETLSEEGDVLTTSTMPVEPKKGGVVWDKAAVRAAHGPMPKKPRAAKAKPAAQEYRPDHPSIFRLGAEKKALQVQLDRANRRAARLAAVLAGRKRQLAAANEALAISRIRQTRLVRQVAGAGVSLASLVHA